MRRNGIRSRFSGERRSFLLCAALGLISMIGFAVQNKGFFYILSDFNTQQIPFTISLHRYLESSPAGGWVWNYELGHSAIQAYGFYAMGSPFFWVSMLFPAGWFPYIVSGIYVIKYGVAGATAYMFLKRFAGKKLHALIGAVAYAFCGFQTVSIQFYHFHDVVALFPLMLTGLEILIRERKRFRLFVFAVFINCITNYFFFVAEVLFVLLYFVFRMPKKEWKEFLKTGCVCLGCGVWGTAMAAVLFIPSMLYMLGYPRLDGGMLNLQDAFAGGGFLLTVLKGLVFPGEGMYQQSSLLVANYDSVSAWLPVIGTALCAAYLLKERGWLSRLLIVLLVTSFVPILSSAFSLFTHNYYRWWFMLALMMALASVKVMDGEKKYPVRLCAGMHTVIVLGVFGVLEALHRFTAKDYIFHEDKLILYTALSLVCYGTVFLVFGKKGLRGRSLLIAVCVMSVCTTCLTLHYNRQYENGEHDRRLLAIGEKLETIDDQYRYNLTANAEMLAGGGSGMTVFSSTQATGTLEFDEMFGHSVTNTSLNKNTVAGLPELFGARYRVVTDPGEAEPVRAFDAEGTKYYVVETEACPIGYRTEQYILKEDLMQVPAEQRGIALLQAAVIQAEDEGKIGEAARKVTPEELELNQDIAETVRRNAAGAVKEFSRDGSGFRCRAAFGEESLVYFSVPYDKGWTAKIDREEKEIIDSGGMMAVVVPPGEHEVEFAYETPGYRIGAVISIIAMLGFVISLVWCRVRH